MNEDQAYETVTHDGLTVSSNSETEDEIRENLESEPEPKDGPTEPEKSEKEKKAEAVSKAAAELGKKGGAAAAKARAAATKEQTDGKSTTELEEGSSPDEKPVGKPRDDPRARMLEATREAAKIKRELAAERAERQRLASELEHARRGSQPERRESEPRDSGDGKPQPGDYESYEEYLDARDDWTRRQWSAEAEAHARLRDRHQQLASHVGQFSKRIEDARKSDPEFHDKIAPEVLELQPSFTLAQGQPMGPSNWIADELVFNPDDAPALMLHFTEHPEDLQRIASLPSFRAVTREMAKLAQRLDAATAGTSSKPEVSKAKPPVRPVSTSPTTADQDEVSDDISFEDHVKRMNSREMKARRGSSRL